MSPGKIKCYKRWGVQKLQQKKTAADKFFVKGCGYQQRLKRNQAEDRMQKVVRYPAGEGVAWERRLWNGGKFRAAKEAAENAGHLSAEEAPNLLFLNTELRKTKTKKKIQRDHVTNCVVSNRPSGRSSVKRETSRKEWRPVVSPAPETIKMQCPHLSVISLSGPNCWKQTSVTFPSTVFLCSLKNCVMNHLEYKRIPSYCES